jgi:hypothetical protein
MKRRGRALKRRYGRATSRPSRKDLIAALGLPPESKYAATTQEFWNKVRHGTSEAPKEARRKLGLKD